jgi:hypothetical protein
VLVPTNLQYRCQLHQQCLGGEGVLVSDRLVTALFLKLDIESNGLRMTCIAVV